MTNRRICAAVPAAAVLIPDVAPAPPRPIVDDIARCRAVIDDIVGQIDDDRELIVVSAGPTASVATAKVAHLAGYGYPHVSMPITAAASAEKLATTFSLTPASNTAVTGEAAVLLHLLNAAGRKVCHVTVPALQVPSISLVDALAEAAGHVIVQGDLSACLTDHSPGYLVDGAAEWDSRACQALRAGDAQAFVGLGPDEAARVQARGWPSLALLTRLCAVSNTPLNVVDYRAPLGVGYVFATTSTLGLDSAAP